jgi:hypothetical protein
MPVVDVTVLTEDELYELEVAVQQERGKRRFLATADEAAETFNRQYLDAAGIVQGGDWTQPAGAHDAYPLGWVTLHNGKEWESLLAFNVWEPGVSGWREIVPEGGGYAEWVQPTGGHDAYNTGDRVTFNAECFESVIDANVWSPTDYPAGWTSIPCEGEPV